MERRARQRGGNVSKRPPKIVVTSDRSGVLSAPHASKVKKKVVFGHQSVEINVRNDV